MQWNEQVTYSNICEANDDIERFKRVKWSERHYSGMFEWIGSVQDGIVSAKKVVIVPSKQ